MRRCLGLMVVIALVAASCGDDEETATTAASSATTAAATTEAPATTAAPTTTQAATTTEAPEDTEPELMEVPLSVVAEGVAADFGEPVECEPYAQGPLVPGSVVICRPSPLPEVGQFATITVLILDETGRHVSSIGGLFNFALNPDVLQSEVSGGFNCTQLLEDGSEFDGLAVGLAADARYFGTVLYWFLEGRPSPLMDIDENGIPCETLFDPEVVDTVWDGGWIATVDAPLIVLAPDGLGVTSFFTQAGDAVDALVDVLGTPTDDSGWVTDGPCAGVHMTLRWELAGASLTAHFTDAESSNPVFSDYGYWGSADTPSPFATPEGITFGSSTGDVVAAYPEVEFGWSGLEGDVIGYAANGMWFYASYAEEVGPETDLSAIEGEVFGMRFPRVGCPDELA